MTDKVVEKFAYHKYEITEQVQSKIDPSVTHTKSIGLVCPFCKEKIRRTIEHAETFKHECWLIMTRHGNGLECELEI